MLSPKRSPISRKIVYKQGKWRIRLVVTKMMLSCQCYGDCSCNEDYMKANPSEEESSYHVHYGYDFKGAFKSLQEAGQIIN